VSRLTIRQSRPWIYFFAFLLGYGLLAGTTLEFPRLTWAYQVFALAIIALFSVARLFEWWQYTKKSTDHDEGLADRLFIRQLAVQKKFHQWFYDE